MIDFIDINTNETIETFPFSLLVDYKKGEIIKIQGIDYEYFKREFIYHKTPDGRNIFIVSIYVIPLG